MGTEEIISLLLDEGNSLTANEKLRAKVPFDKLYIDEKIKRHERLLIWSKLVIVLLVVINAASLLVLFLFNDIEVTSSYWLRGVLAVLFIVALLGLPSAIINHGRNATILRVIRDIRKSQGEI
ncbi:MAG: hypothetical protein ACFNO7_07715 [Bacteroides sp.]|jgi:hypothetical protein